MNASASASPWYQGLSLWNTSAPKILWINDGFDEKSHLVLRGLRGHPLENSFGTADRKEALRRQNLVRLFVENDRLRGIALAAPLASTSVSHIPNEGQPFVNYFDPAKRNPFWTAATEFASAVNSLESDALARNPDVAAFAQCLCGEGSTLEPLERAMGENVIKELLKATEIDGTVTVRLSYKNSFWTFSVVDRKAVGHRLYALNPPSKEVKISPFWGNVFWVKLGVYSNLYKAARRRNAEKVRAWAKPIIMTECPAAIEADISVYLKTLLAGDSKGVFPVPENKTDVVDLVVRFAYKGDGLRIKIVGLSDNQQVPDSYEKDVWQSAMPVGRFDYYSQAESDRALALAMQMRHRSYVTHLLSNFYPKLRRWLTANASTLVSEAGHIVPSEESDKLFKWSHAETLCCTERWLSVYERSRAIRDYAWEHTNTLYNAAKIAEAFVDMSKRTGLPLSFPELVDDKTASLSFEELWPVHLIGRVTSGSAGKPIKVSDLRPITALGNVPVGISMITGDNGAGKTTLSEELLGVLFDAGSGFPVFGRGVKLNLRTVVGSIYLERGEGSTMQLSLVKLAQVLREVGKHPMNGTFVLWDEAGTGTSASQGEILGMAALSKLRDIGCTVLVNTQVPRLAERAQSELGARCFKVDMAHRIAAGIGEPNIVELAKSMGIDGELNLSGGKN